MLDPPPMIEFLEIYACAVRISRHALKWTHAAIATQNSSTVQSSIQWQDREQALVSS